MQYYTINDGNLLIAGNETALTRYYDNVAELPEDYTYDKYIVVDNELVINPDYEREHFEQVKALKLKEAETKCSEKRYNQTFTVELQEQECEFDTTEQTQSDLQTAAIVTSTGGTYDNWVTNNGVVLNLTAEDVQMVFVQFFSLVSPLYTKQLEYIQQINACETAEEIEAIVINYDDEAEEPQIEETEEEEVNETVSPESDIEETENITEETN